MSFQVTIEQFGGVGTQGNPSWKPIMFQFANAGDQVDFSLDDFHFHAHYIRPKEEIKNPLPFKQDTQYIRPKEEIKNPLPFKQDTQYSKREKVQRAIDFEILPMARALDEIITKLDKEIRGPTGPTGLCGHGDADYALGYMRSALNRLRFICQTQEVDIKILDEYNDSSMEFVKK